MITGTAIECLVNVMDNSSFHVRLALIEADLIAQLITSVNPKSLSFTDAAEIHTYLMAIIMNSVWFASRIGLDYLGIDDPDEERAVHETVFKQVVVPSESYICQVCVNRYMIVDGWQSDRFQTILYRILLTITSCLTYFERDVKQEWKWEGGEVQQMWKKVHRMLRMEGIEDVTIHFLSQSPSIDHTLSLPTLALLAYESQFGRISHFALAIACFCALPVILELWINCKVQSLESDFATQHCQDQARMLPEQ
ncbi:hypothetical protein BLNAU_4130 [Blattamonas nauphoetae]|uniref:Uncharacterized protein n=1 Tax=Blattamonas nauphoetae TaxID=2049346 RepID=A0ABQ9YBI8_9EUKA|nr:hypothetical protein BLNAU_4130 [Blattamonas nauphoetae]